MGYLENLLHEEVCQALEQAAQKLLRKAELSFVEEFRRYIGMAHRDIV